MPTLSRRHFIRVASAPFPQKFAISRNRALCVSIPPPSALVLLSLISLPSLQLDIYHPLSLFQLLPSFVSTCSVSRSSISLSAPFDNHTRQIPSRTTSRPPRCRAVHAIHARPQPRPALALQEQETACWVVTSTTWYEVILALLFAAEAAHWGRPL